MNYGFNISASGVLTNMYRLDVAANNLANLETPGFKPDAVGFSMRQAAHQEGTGSFLPSNAMLERLGAGVKLAPNRVQMGQGVLETTKRPLDIALRGEGFLTVQAPPASKDKGPRLTRDGRMSLNSSGQLVMSATGLAVLDDRGKPITLTTDGPHVTIENDGTIKQGRERVARLGTVSVPDAALLAKQGDGLYAPTAGQWKARKAATVQVEQGALERSGVDPVLAMLEVNKAQRAIEDNARMIQIRDEMTQRAVGTFGRIA